MLGAGWSTTASFSGAAACRCGWVGLVGALRATAGCVTMQGRTMPLLPTFAATPSLGVRAQQTPAVQRQPVNTRALLVLVLAAASHEDRTLAECPPTGGGDGGRAGAHGGPGCMCPRHLCVLCSRCSAAHRAGYQENSCCPLSIPGMVADTVRARTAATLRCGLACVRVPRAAHALPQFNRRNMCQASYRVPVHCGMHTAALDTHGLEHQHVSKTSRARPRWRLVYAACTAQRHEGNNKHATGYSCGAVGTAVVVSRRNFEWAPGPRSPVLGMPAARAQRVMLYLTMSSRL